MDFPALIKQAHDTIRGIDNLDFDRLALHGVLQALHEGLHIEWPNRVPGRMIDGLPDFTGCDTSAKMLTMAGFTLHTHCLTAAFTDEPERPAQVVLRDNPDFPGMTVTTQHMSIPLALCSANVGVLIQVIRHPAYAGFASVTH